LNDERVERLRRFVEYGGRLVLTIRSGMKDEHNALLPLRQPGRLAEIAGAEVEDYYALVDPVPVVGHWFSSTSKIWAERLIARQDATRVLARFGPSNGWLDGHPALTANPCGLGQVYLVGAWLDEVAQKALIDNILAECGVVSPWEATAGVEVARRVDNVGREVWIIINHERTERTVSLPWPARDHIGGRTVQGQLALSDYGIAVLTRLDS
jgi:beta-galactosidase